MTVAGIMPSPGLRLQGNSAKVLGSSFLSPSSSRSLAVASGKGRVPAVSLGSSRNNSLVVRNVVSTDTEKRDGFARISEEDYAENFRPPHITDIFDIPARASTFCAKTR